MGVPHQLWACATSMSFRLTVLVSALVFMENAKCSPDAKCVGWAFQSLHCCDVAQLLSTIPATTLTMNLAGAESIGSSCFGLSRGRTVSAHESVRYRTLVLSAQSSRRAALRLWSHGGGSRRSDDRQDRGDCRPGDGCRAER